MDWKKHSDYYAYYKKIKVGSQTIDVWMTYNTKHPKDRFYVCASVYSKRKHIDSDYQECKTTGKEGLKTLLETRILLYKGENMKFYTADLHFDHWNIVKYCNRPFKTIEDMNDTMIKNWNKKVCRNDEVFILGDFTMSKGDRPKELLSSLNGKKYLVIGNHDHFVKKNIGNYKDDFEWIKDYMMIQDNGTKVVLSHFPMIDWECRYHGSIHLYGHIHNSDLHYELLGNKNMFNVGVDVQDFDPKTLKELTDNQKEEYVNDGSGD